MLYSLVGVSKVEGTAKATQASVKSLTRVTSEELLSPDNFDLGKSLDDVKDKFQAFRGEVMNLTQALEKLSAMHKQPKDFYKSKLPAYVQNLLTQIPQVPVPEKNMYVRDFENLVIGELSKLFGSDEDRQSGTTAIHASL